MAQNTKLARLMLERGISSQDVTKALKFSKGNFSLIKNGYQNITTATLKKLCKFFKCSPNDLLDWEPWLEEKKAA
jgi:DNA-binding Xre family transcriptional regulator